MSEDTGKKTGAGKRISIEGRPSKVEVGDFASLPPDFSWYAHLASMIPGILRGRDLEELSRRVAGAAGQGKPVILMMGAHVVKCGISGIICDLIRKRIVTGVAVNGAFAIHDLEIALWGKTSEDVGAGLEQGSFGMTEETASHFNTASGLCLEQDLGLGEALGVHLAAQDPPNSMVSVIATAHRVGIPMTVHVALGTDVVHQHAEADGRALGHGSMKDFRRFAAAVARLDGGVVLNMGSAVIMPEVFLKAVAMARNAGADLGDFTTANFDMFSLYRPAVNVVERPRLIGGTTYSFIGHHEILLPVFFASILAELRA
jgi:hypothetical protein